MSDLSTILVRAIIANDLSKIARLFAGASKKTSLLYCRNAQGNEPIHVASSHGYEDIVKLLIKLGSDPDKENEYGWTPLMLASFYGRTGVVQFLLSLKSVNPQKINSFGLNALKCCVYGFHEEILNILLTQDIDINHGGTQGLGMTALMIACRVKNHNAVKKLIFHGSDCNYQSKSNGWTALFYAIHHDDSSLIEILLSARAEPNLSDWSGRTPKTVAAAMGCDTEVFDENYTTNFINDLSGMNKEKSELDSSANFFFKNRRRTNAFQKADIPTESGLERTSSNTKFSIMKLPSYSGDGRTSARDSFTGPGPSKLHKGFSELDYVPKPLSTTDKPGKGFWWNTVGKKLNNL